MNTYEISLRVNRAITAWRGEAPDKVSIGAAGLLVQIIDNIRSDPSPAWILDDSSAAQGRAIESIPAILDRVQELSPNRRITTWEFMHAASAVLEEFCFIKKRRRR